MSPFGRLSAALIVALIMWVPAGMSLFRGKLDILMAGIWLVAALVIAYFGTGIIANLINSYGAQQRRALEKARRVQQEIREIEHKRRKADKQ